jgi:hypothetical protein
VAWFAAVIAVAVVARAGLGRTGPPLPHRILLLHDDLLAVEEAAVEGSDDLVELVLLFYLHEGVTVGAVVAGLGIDRDHLALGGEEVGELLVELARGLLAVEVGHEDLVFLDSVRFGGLEGRLAVPLG